MTPEQNGNVKQGDFFRELKEIRKDISSLDLKVVTYHSEVIQAATDRMSLREALKGLAEWKDQTEERLEGLESREKIRDRQSERKEKEKDRRVQLIVALVGAGGVGFGVLVQIVASLIIAG